MSGRAPTRTHARSPSIDSTWCERLRVTGIQGDTSGDVAVELEFSVEDSGSYFVALYRLRSRDRVPEFRSPLSDREALGSSKLTADRPVVVRGDVPGRHTVILHGEDLAREAFNRGSWMIGAQRLTPFDTARCYVSVDLPPTPLVRLDGVTASSARGDSVQVGCEITSTTVIEVLIVVSASLGGDRHPHVSRRERLTVGSNYLRFRLPGIGSSARGEASVQIYRGMVAIAHERVNLPGGGLK